MSTSAQYAATPKNGSAQISVANTNRDGTGTLVAVRTAGASGGRVDKLTIQATAATTGGMVRLFLDVGGSIRLIKEIPVPPVTPTATVPAWSTDIYLDLNMEAAAILKASTHNAETFNVIPTDSGDY